MTRGVRLVLWALLGSAAGAQEPEVFLTPFSHLDFYWGGTREECLARGNYIIAKAIKLAKESPQFRFPANRPARRVRVRRLTDRHAQ